MLNTTRFNDTLPATEYSIGLVLVATGATLAATMLSSQIAPIWALALATLQRVAGA